MTIETITLLLTALSAVGALAAAIASWLSVSATTKAAEAQLFSAHYAAYGSPEMLRALRILRIWKAETEGDFAQHWRQALDSHDPRAIDVDLARRHVKSYFLRALRIYEAGFVSVKFLKEVANVDGINILFDIVENLELALNPQYDKPAFDQLREICGRARTGKLLQPISPPPVSKRLGDGG